MIQKAAILLGLLMAWFLPARAQRTDGHVGIERYPINALPSYLAQLGSAKADTSKVDLLLKIGAIYHSSEARGWLDSAIIFGRQAAVLSKSLNYTNGYNNACYLLCTTFCKKRDLKAASLVLHDVHGEMSVCILLTLAEYYINFKDATPDELRLALPYLNQAIKRSEELKSRKWTDNSLSTKAKYHYRVGEMTAGKNLFIQIIQHYKEVGNKERQAHWWYDLGLYIPDSDSTYAIEIYSFQQAAKLFKEIGDIASYAETLWHEAYIYGLNNRQDLAEKFYLADLETLKSAKLDDEITASYQRLSGFYEKQKNFDKALQYAFLSLKNMQARKDSSQLSSVYMTLGNINYALNNYPESVKYYKLVYATTPVHRVWTFDLLRLLTDSQIKSGQAAEGIRFLRAFLRDKAPNQTSVNKQTIALAFGNCYAALGNYATAEKYYLEMIRLNSAAEYSLRTTSGKLYPITGAEAFLTIGRFYAQAGKFTQAGPYLRSALTAWNLNAVFERDTRHLLFKVDSAAGNYLGAIRNYQRFKMLSDSVEAITKNKEVSVMQANFKAAQKEKDIKLLTKDAALQREKLELAARTEKFTYGGFAVLLFLLGLSYSSYRAKQSKNRQLEEQQKTISIKNSSLMQLVNEKEWLLREVHHRVKNNLQIVISLLNSQSAYLKEEVAVNAIVESRHRIQAMSMLHQRIYQSEDMTSIGMTSYIHELVSYLGSSFNTGRRIILNVYVEKIELDLSQAVPIGLILNEAITNSLKYAFPDDREGEVKVTFAKAGEDEIVLSIHDDGIGFPPGFDLGTIKTFGLKLIKGLTEDLEGTFFVESGPGTTLRVLFPFRLVQVAHPADAPVMAQV
ncbi:hypothetical protein GCM10010967_33330 [Dyadobacter beijingensis]|uniref:histidine kinase n=1 Tax=Dyadobacter beijingensis TaxID=365489 RepID=A0ABQ2I2Z9_9BACT|nr:histidine kinase dimerization/phosphoacceptor domain -containing protein [Dyadobacter beijingensis]GGM96902.1 hypothetical protein GCM10010967_33330 [Dyadobacter beijingensis]